jgi:hypothetical protein
VRAWGQGQGRRRWRAQGQGRGHADGVGRQRSLGRFISLQLIQLNITHKIHADALYKQPLGAASMLVMLWRELWSFE